MKGIISMLILLSVCIEIQAQSGYPSEKAINVIPTSPAAASLLSYGKVPVNMFTGTANLSIPLYKIAVKNVSVPISLSYQATGVKVEEIASPFGMGWSLSLGGVITKTIRGMNDEIPQGYPDGSGDLVQRYVNNQLTTSERQGFSLGMTQGGYDGEPDLFSYSFGEYQGEFFFTPEGQVRQRYGEPLKISVTYNAASNVHEFIITDPRGTKYYFSDRELTENVTTFSSDGTIAPLDPQNYTSAWHLSKIVTKTGEEITFEYNTVTISPTYLGSRSVYYLRSVTPATDCTGNAPAQRFFGTSSTNRTNITQKKIKRVVFPSGEISIKYQSQARTDLPRDTAIHQLIIKNKGGETLNSFTFTHTYFSNRLFLTQLLDASAARPYQFFYDAAQNLPGRTSMAQDYWGYYNGKTSNSTLIPQTNSAAINGRPLFNFIEGADREPDFAYGKLGVLNRVIYPTGGETRFTYESHQYGNITGATDVVDTVRTTVGQVAAVTADPTGWKQMTFVVGYGQEIDVITKVSGLQTKTELTNSGGTILLAHYSTGSTQLQTLQRKIYLEPGTYKIRAFNYEQEFFASIQVNYKQQTAITISKSRLGGGLRIREIADYSDAQTLANRRSYEYTLKADPGRSSGILVTNYIHEYLQNRSGPLRGCSSSSVYTAVYYVRLAASAVPLSAASGSHVEYSEVIEKYDNGDSNGKKITLYTSARELDNRDINSYSYPFMASMSRAYKRGKVSREETYKWQSGNYTLIHEVQNEYEALTSSDVLYGLSIAVEVENPSVPQNNTYVHNYYFILRDYHALTSSVERNLDGGVAELRTNYYYDNRAHFRPNRISKLKSDGSYEVEYISYPHDYANTTGFIGEMKNNHLIAYPIEQVKYKEVGTTRTILSGTMTTYKTGGKGLIDQVNALQTLSPVPLASFRFSNRAMGQLPPGGTVGSYFPDSRYQLRLTYNEYDGKGNPLQTTQADGTSTSYVWGYGHQYPIAEIKNGARATVVTALGGASNVTNFGNQVNPTESSVATFLAPLRTAATLKQAQVTTYTYKPLVGMTSKTDPSGRRVSYEYDGFGRLIRIKDHFGNVMEEYKYNYRP